MSLHDVTTFCIPYKKFKVTLNLSCLFDCSFSYFVLGFRPVMLENITGYHYLDKNAIYGKNKQGDTLKEYTFNRLNYINLNSLDNSGTSEIPQTTTFNGLDEYMGADGRYMMNGAKVMGLDVVFNFRNHKGNKFCFINFIQLRTK